jgi:hypothetical protein
VVIACGRLWFCVAPALAADACGPESASAKAAQAAPIGSRPIREAVRMPWVPTFRGMMKVVPAQRSMSMAL